MAVKGIDVSRYQGDIDFRKVKEDGYEFVIIQAGFGRFISQKDKYFEQNYRNAKSAGLKVGAYWYSYAVTAAQAKAEAEVFLEVIKGKSFEYPVCMDIENESQRLLSDNEVGDIVNAFCSHMESAGYYAAIYSYANFLKSKIPAECRKKYDVWIASFDVSAPDYSGNYGMWQYSNSGRVNGIRVNCDLDYAYKDYPAIMTEKGLNGFGTERKRLDENGFRKGDRGNGVLSLKQLLTLARLRGEISQGIDNNGIFGDGTQKAVNALLKKWGYTQNGIAGENFIKRLGEELQKD